MPHAGLMDAEALGPVAAPLLRARLHLRGGKRRLRQGKIAAGIVTLYDALDSALQWFLAEPGHGLLVAGSPPSGYPRELYRLVRERGILDDRLDMEALEALVDRALEGEMPGYDYGPLLEAVEQAMTHLGVMPFEEEALPPEDPATF